MNERGDGDGAGPGASYVWDMSVCHTWWTTYGNHGNVPSKYGFPSNIWEGDEPPPGPDGPNCALFICLPG
jgi:hypothetical protein